MVAPAVPGPAAARPRLGRLVFPSFFALGMGATDALFYVYLIDSIRNLGGKPLQGLGALAAGAAVSLILAPLTAAVSDLKLGGRKPLTLLFNLSSLLLAAAVGIIVGTAPGEAADGVRDLPGRAAAVAIAGAVYRALTLSSPSVPTLIETSLHGDAAGFPARRDAALSFFYIWTRVGLFGGSLVAFLMPSRTEPLWFLVSAASIGVATLATSSGLVHRPPAKGPPPPGAEPPPPKPSVFGKMVSDQKKALLRTPPGLLQLYITCFLYGIAYGQFNAIVAPYYSQVIFSEPAGSTKTVRWTAMASLINIGVGLLTDALAPKAAKAVGPRASRWLWPAVLLIGAGLFTGLVMAQEPPVAITLLSSHAIVIAGHSFFSLVGAGALVHPSLRATTFGARLASQIAGNVVGNLVAGYLGGRRDEGFRDVMALSAAVCVAAALAALAVGEFPPLERAKGVATNANVLVSYTFGKHHKSSWGPTVAAAAAASAEGGGGGGSGGGGPGGGTTVVDGAAQVQGDVEAIKQPAYTKLGTAPEWSMDYWRDDEWMYEEEFAALAVPELSPLTPTPSGMGPGGGFGGQHPPPGPPPVTIGNFADGWK